MPPKTEISANYTDSGEATGLAVLPREYFPPSGRILQLIGRMELQKLGLRKLSKQMMIYTNAISRPHI
jgi:hypothetical protein